MSKKRILFGVDIVSKIKEKNDPNEWARKTESMIQKYLGMAKSFKVYKLVKTAYEKPSEIKRKKSKLRRKQLDKLIKIRGDWKDTNNRRRSVKKFNVVSNDSGLRDAFAQLNSENHK